MGRGLKAKGRSSRKPAAPGRLRQFWGRYSLVIKPCAVFFGSVAGFLFFYSRFVGTQPFDAYLAFNAWTTGLFLNLTGGGVEVRGTVVSSEAFGFRIVDLCTASVPMMIFASAVLAFPARAKEKALGLLLGLGGIFLVNSLRLVSLFYIGVYVPSVFTTTHLLVWQSLMILLAIGLWLLWVQRYVRAPAY